MELWELGSLMKLDPIFNPFTVKGNRLRFIKRVENNLLLFRSKNVSGSKATNPHAHWFHDARALDYHKSWTVSNVYKFLSFVRHIRKRTHVLDLGCGSGFLIHFLHWNAKPVYYHGIDVSKQSRNRILSPKTQNPKERSFHYWASSTTPKHSCTPIRNCGLGKHESEFLILVPKIHPYHQTSKKISFI